MRLDRRAEETRAPQYPGCPRRLSHACWKDLRSLLARGEEPREIRAPRDVAKSPSQSGNSGACHFRLHDDNPAAPVRSRGPFHGSRSSGCGSRLGQGALHADLRSPAFGCPRARRRPVVGCKRPRRGRAPMGSPTDLRDSPCHCQARAGSQPPPSITRPA